MLTSRQRLSSFSFLVLLPYLEAKLARIHTRMEQQQQQHQHETHTDDEIAIRIRLLRRFQRLFVQVFPMVRTIWHSSQLVVHVLSLFGRTESFTPGLWLSGLHLARLSQDDYKYYTDARESELSAREKRYGSLSFVRRLTSTSLDGAKDVARIAVPAGIFFMSFMSWWYSSGQGTQKNASAIPNPPKAPIKAREGLMLPADISLCPICRQPRTNPTALASSGLVFCYPCIYKHIEQHHRCPVSCVPASVEMLIRIHD